MVKNESKYFYTAQLMNQALISLLEKKDIEFITVTEITNKAGVNRSTFYLHYENIYELLEETIKNINENYFEELLSEKIEYRNGKMSFRQINRRNEALDTLVYALAALELLGCDVNNAPVIDLAAIKAQNKEQQQERQTEQQIQNQPLQNQTATTAQNRIVRRTRIANGSSFSGNFGGGFGGGFGSVW